MDIHTTKIIEEFNTLTFNNIKSNKEIIVCPHAFDHLSAKQRKIFKAEELIYMIEKERPRKRYLQKNGRYAIYYRKDDGYRKLILDVKDDELIIVTFIDTLELPKIRLK